MQSFISVLLGRSHWESQHRARRRGGAGKQQMGPEKLQDPKPKGVMGEGEEWGWESIAEIRAGKTGINLAQIHLTSSTCC